MNTFTVTAVFRFLSDRPAFQLFNLSAALKDDPGPDFIRVESVTAQDTFTSTVQFAVPAHDQQDADGRILSLFGNHHEEYSIRVLLRSVLTPGATLIETSEPAIATEVTTKGSELRNRTASALRAARSQNVGCSCQGAKVSFHKGRPVAKPTGKARPEPEHVQMTSRPRVHWWGRLTPVLC